MKQDNFKVRAFSGIKGRLALAGIVLVLAGPLIVLYWMADHLAYYTFQVSDIQKITCSKRSVGGACGEIKGM